MNPVVVKVGGSAVGAPPSLWSGLASLSKRAGGLVLVHGGGASVDAQLRRLGESPTKREGIRVTPPEHIWPVVQVLAGEVNTLVVGRLLRNGARGVGLMLSDGGLCECKRATKYGFDPGRVGEVEWVDTSVLRCLLGGGFTPVVSSVGVDSEGEPLNINADDAALAVARAVHADELILLTDVPGVLDENRSIIPTLDRGSGETLIRSGVIGGGMIPKVRAALESADNLGRSVRIAGVATYGAKDIGGSEGTRVLPSIGAVVATGGGGAS